MPPVSDNPAYKLVTVCSHQKKDNTKTQFMHNYEEIEEVYFKHTTTEDSNTGDYEIVDCHQ